MVGKHDFLTYLSSAVISRAECKYVSLLHMANILAEHEV